jgi:hypothetical protein
MDEKEFEGFFKQLGKYGEFVKQQFMTNVDPGQIQKIMDDYEDFSVNFSKSMGMGRESIVEIKRSFADAVVSVNQLGGNLSDLPGIAENIGKALNRSVIPLKDAYADIYATHKVTGVATETMAKGFKDAGFSIYNMSENMTKVVNLARETGINVKVVSSQVVSNLDMMDKYNFSNGVEGLAKMVTESTKLRISVDNIKGTLDSAFKPEGAIDMAAALQRLGVAQSDLLDPLRLMDMSRNDPAEFQKQIAEMSKSFVDFNEKTKQFEILPGAKEQVMEVEKALNMTPGTFAKMAKSAAEFEDKMKKISFSDKFNQEEKELIANLSEMKGGEYKLRVNGEELRIDEAMVKVQNMGEEERKKFFESTKPKSMEDLAREQLTIQEQSAGYLKSIAGRTAGGLAGTQTNETLLQAQLEIAKSVPKVFAGERFQAKEIRETVDTAVGQVQKGYDSGNLLGGLSEGGQTISKYLSGAADDFVTGIGTALTDLKNSDNALIKVFGDVASKGGELISSHEKLQGSFGSLTETVNKTNTALNNPATKNLTTGVLEKSKDVAGGTNKSEVKFTEPLVMKVVFEGDVKGLTEEQVLDLIKRGKADIIIDEATKRATNYEIKQPTNQ